MLFLLWPLWKPVIAALDEFLDNDDERYVPDPNSRNQWKLSGIGAVAGLFGLLLFCTPLLPYHPLARLALACAYAGGFLLQLHLIDGKPLGVRFVPYGVWTWLAGCMAIAPMLGDAQINKRQQLDSAIALACFVGSVFVFKHLYWPGDAGDVTWWLIFSVFLFCYGMMLTVKVWSYDRLPPRF